jgi:hypothetical protein
LDGNRQARKGFTIVDQQVTQAKHLPYAVQVTLKLRSFVEIALSKTSDTN